MTQFLQDIHAPRSACFGCGPANPQGLQLKSRFENGKVVAEWKAQPHHAAFPGALNGGIIGTLLDCHCNWTAAYALMQRDGLDQIPPTVTAEYTIKMIQLTPADQPLDLVGEIVKLSARSAHVRGLICCGAQTTATCEAIFVAVKPDHPAFHRWEA